MNNSINYINRHIEATAKEMSKLFSAVLVTGPRQVGKSTMVKRILPDNVNQVTLDDTQELLLAREQPQLFFKQWTPPVFVDEIQYEPELFRRIKILIDKDHVKGQFFLTGSQMLPLMKNASESLAGRVGIINMQGLSYREINGVTDTMPFIPTEKYLQSAKSRISNNDYWNIWNTIYRGSLPEMQNPKMTPQKYYPSYVTTYLEKDVRGLAHVGNILQFSKFMTLAAAQTGNLLNYDSMAKAIGVSTNTVKSWISILLSSGIIYLLEPYSRNLSKRTVKTPKLYFMDTGLVCHLTRWNTAEQAATGAMNGALFETFVVSEIIKSYYNTGITNPPLSFYRDKDGIEIDLIVEENGVLYPVEIKVSGNSDKRDIKSFRQLEKIPELKKGIGCIIAFADELRYIDEENFMIPVTML